MKRFTLVAILALAGLALAGCDSDEDEASPTATATATSAPSPTTSTTPQSSPTAPSVGGTTEVIRYLPAKPAAGTTQDGSCFARSASLSWREDAYRCMVVNGIYDPCFALPDGVIVCGADPTKADAKPFILRPTAPLPKEPLNTAQIEAGTKNGWLVTLADGTVCGFLTGATTGFEGQRINYGCTNRTSILGDLMPGAPWTARFVTGSVGPNGFTPATDEVKALARVYQ